MAKLSSHGHELYRLTKAHEETDPTSITTVSEWLVSVRSDGAVLEKLKVRWREDGRWHDYGWKLKYTGARLRAVGHTPEKVVEIYTMRHGYKVTSRDYEHTRQLAAANG